MPVKALREYADIGIYPARADQPIGPQLAKRLAAARAASGFRRTGVRSSRAFPSDNDEPATLPEPDGAQPSSESDHAAPAKPGRLHGGHRRPSAPANGGRARSNTNSLSSRSTG